MPAALHIVDVALPVPVDTAFTYIVPEELLPAVKIGSRVLVPFGTKYLTGIVVGFPKEQPHHHLKPLHDVLDAEPIFSEELLGLCRWIARYYIVPLGEVVRAATPQGLSPESRRFVTLTAPLDEDALRSIAAGSKKKAQLLHLLNRSSAVTVKQLQKKTGIRSIHSVLAVLAVQGAVRIEEKLLKESARPKYERYVAVEASALDALRTRLPAMSSRSPKQAELLSALLDRSGNSPDPIGIRELLSGTHASLSSLKAVVKLDGLSIVEREVVRRDVFTPDAQSASITLNPHQEQSLRTITGALSEGTYRSFLLHGITGSGKTQVYIEAIRAVRAMGKTAIVLVPEISLTPQTVRRFKTHFGDDVTVMHSRMSVGERYDSWSLARTGKCPIVIGPRSAIFAPVANLGLIVVDEEHESSYKQFDASPRYNARDVAAVRALQSNAVVVFGSATPSVESYSNALGGKYTLLELPERVDAAKLPAIRIVDMVAERREAHRTWLEQLRKEKSEQTEKKWIERKFEFGSISSPLKKAIEVRLAKKEGIILLQNRRGYSPILECLDCGFVQKCDHCAVTMTYHQTKKNLRCHYCGSVKPLPAECPACKSKELTLSGVGTQRVEEELARLFPAAKIVRMDLDTTTRKGAHDKLLGRFGRGEADILLGTQMVAKGLDFPRVTLVGVVSADTQMLLPDFRSSERTFQLLTQVAGRAGRSVLSGEVVIQTHQPGHFSLVHVIDHDFKSFYKEELTHRRELNYPPFSRIILVEFKGGNEAEVERHAKAFADILRRGDHRCEILGPAPAAIPKIKNNFRWHIVIKELKQAESGGGSIHSVLNAASRKYAAILPSRQVQLIIDVDPQGMM